MTSIHWDIKRGDLVKISSSQEHSSESYGVVMSCEPYVEQISLFPVVMVFSFYSGRACEYYPYNLEIVSAAP